MSQQVQIEQQTYNSSLNNMKSILEVYKKKLEDENKISDFESEKNINLNDMFDKLDKIDLLEGTELQNLMDNIKIFGEYVLDTLALQDSQKLELKKLKDQTKIIYEFRQQQISLKNDVNSTNNNFFQRAWSKKRVRIAVPTLWTWLIVWWWIKLVKKIFWKKNKWNSNNSQTADTKNTSSWNNSWWNSNNSSWWFWKWTKRIALWVAGVFGIKTIVKNWNNISDWFWNIFWSEKTEERKKLSEQLADSFNDVTYNENDDTFVFSQDWYTFIKPAVDITDENWLSSWRNLQIENIKQIKKSKDLISSITLASWVSLNIDTENLNYILSYKWEEKTKSLFDIEDVDELNSWIEDKISDIDSDIANDTTIDDINSKLETDEVYRKNCELVWTNVNNFYSSNDLNFELWKYDFERLSNWQSTTATVVSWLDSVYQYPSRLLQNDTLSFLQSKWDPSKLKKLRAKIWMKAKISMLRLLWSSIPEIWQMNVDLWITNIDFSKPINSISTNVQDNINWYINKIQQDQNNILVVFNEFFEQEMWIISYFRLVSKKLKYSIAKKMLLSDWVSFSNSDPNIITDEDIKQIETKLQDDDFNKKVDNCLKWVFEKIKISEFCSNKDDIVVWDITIENDLLQSAILNPISVDKSKKISKINQDIDNINKKFDSISLTDTQKVKKISEDFLKEVYDYKIYKWYDCFVEPMKTILWLEQWDIDKMRDSFEANDDFMKDEKNLAQSIVDDDWNVSQDQIDKLKNAYLEFYNQKKLHTLFGETVFDVRQDTSNNSWTVNIMSNYFWSISSLWEQVWKWLSFTWSKNTNWTMGIVWKIINSVVIALSWYIVWDPLTYIPRKIIKAWLKIIWKWWVKNFSMSTSYTEAVIKKVFSRAVEKLSEWIRPYFALKLWIPKIYSGTWELYRDIYRWAISLDDAVDILNMWASNWKRMNGVIRTELWFARSDSITKKDLLKKMWVEFDDLISVNKFLDEWWDIKTIMNKTFSRIRFKNWWDPANIYKFWINDWVVSKLKNVYEQINVYSWDMQEFARKLITNSNTLYDELFNFIKWFGTLDIDLLKRFYNVWNVDELVKNILRNKSEFNVFLSEDFSKLTSMLSSTRFSSDLLLPWESASDIWIKETLTRRKIVFDLLDKHKSIDDIVSFIEKYDSKRLSLLSNSELDNILNLWGTDLLNNLDKMVDFKVKLLTDYENLLKKSSWLFSLKFKRMLPNIVETLEKWVSLTEWEINVLSKLKSWAYNVESIMWNITKKWINGIDTWLENLLKTEWVEVTKLPKLLRIFETWLWEDVFNVLKVAKNVI